MSAQWVCITCGYNMIGEAPDVCPFCGARHDKFVSSEQAEQTYRVTTRPVADRVEQLLCVPRLGLEHAAYRVTTSAGAVWIDCPSAFNRDLEAVGAIYFTHQDFLGACNQYRELWDAQVYLHALEAARPLAQNFPIDETFTTDFVAGDVSAYHVGGHSPGFTMYVVDDVLFSCDYAFPAGPSMKFNPFSDQAEIRRCAARVLEIAQQRSLRTVCAYNYVADFESWIEDFRRLAA